MNKYFGFIFSIFFVLIIAGCQQKKEDSIVFNLPEKWNKSNIVCTVVKEKNNKNTFEKEFSVNTYFKDIPVEVPRGYFNQAKVVFVGVYNKNKEESNINYMEPKELEKYLATQGKKVASSNNFVFVDSYGDELKDSQKTQGVFVYF